MARRTGNHRRNLDDDEERPRRAQRRGPSPNPMALGLFVLAVVAIGFAGFANRGKNKSANASDEAQPAGPERSNPFADVERETGPTRLNPGGGRSDADSIDLAPVGLLDDPVWASAAELANKAYALAKDAETAKKAEDYATFNTKAVEARELFDRAIEDTAVWESELQEKYGDTDRTVKKVLRERDKWFEYVRKFRKAGLEAVK